MFYEERLHSREGLEHRKIDGHPWLSQSHLWFVPVNHEGNQNASPEEIECIALIVSPYNAQVSDLLKRLPNARAGTVDKFQGQEAPVVIYSMATSSPQDAPRGMEFLYSLNRLNVATSRAKGMVIVVASPRLLEPECRNPRQMQLANALCRYVELAEVAAPLVRK